MKHSYIELFKIEGDITGVFSAEAVKGLTNIYPISASPEPRRGYRRVWTNKEKTASKRVYTYGEKIWFDTEKERDAYRAEQNRIKAEKRRASKEG